MWTSVFLNLKSFFLHKCAINILKHYINSNQFHKKGVTCVEPFKTFCTCILVQFNFQKKKFKNSPFVIIVKKQNCTLNYNIRLHIKINKLLVLWVLFGIKIDIRFEKLYDKWKNWYNRPAHESHMSSTILERTLAFRPGLLLLCAWTHQHTTQDKWCEGQETFFHCIHIP
jgi:hypothetical protein